MKPTKFQIVPDLQASWKFNLGKIECLCVQSSLQFVFLVYKTIIWEGGFAPPLVCARLLMKDWFSVASICVGGGHLS